MVQTLENLLFRHRGPFLLLIAALTVVMAHFALQLRLDAGFAKQLPSDHEFIKTFFEHQDELAGSNRLIVALSARDGDIWNPEFLRKLDELTDAVVFLPGVDRRTVSSIWTPNTFYFEINEEGMTADLVAPAQVLPASLDAEDIALVRDNVVKGGFVGRLVANDHSAAMITAELIDVDPRTETRLDYLALDRLLEEQIRLPHETDEHQVHIVGFVKLIGDIANGAASVVQFFVLAFVLTAAAVYFYARSWILTFLPLFCSLVSVIWQFGAIHLLGFGLDPLAILVPFLVFAIGVSHGVQQINLISKEVCDGADAMTAARRSFHGLLVPGTMALVTDLIGFGTLILIPIGMIQELGITALVGVAFKIVTNLFLLPVLASYFTFDAGYVAREGRARATRDRWVGHLGAIAEPRNATLATVCLAALFVVAAYQGQGRHVGDLHPGAPELRPDSRYNRDVVTIVESFDVGLDVLTVIATTPSEGCIDYETMDYLARFSWHMRNVPGVLSVASLPLVAKQVNAGWTEGNLKWFGLPRNRYSLVKVAGLLPESTGLVNVDCSLMPVYVFTADHKAETIKEVITAVRTFREEQPMEGVNLGLASGNVGVMAATNEELEASELPMMLYVYAAIVVLVLATYGDWRATICCCVPLSLATLLGYWFMRELGIGLKVSTMPVMVLAVGLGVDYAFYIYSRLRVHLAEGHDMTASFRRTLSETGTAVIFTAVTLAIGVSTWTLSDLKFQADMGLLLTFMFMINMIMAVTFLPALAVVLDRIAPRRRRS